MRDDLTPGPCRASITRPGTAEWGENKCSLAFLKRRLRDEGIDAGPLWDRITRVVVKSLFCVDDTIAFQPNSFEVRLIAPLSGRWERWERWEMWEMCDVRCEMCDVRCLSVCDVM